MLAITILLLAAAPATHHARTAHQTHALYRGHVRHAARSLAMTPKKLLVVTAATTPARSPYRLPLNLPAGPDGKDLALNEDGSRCAVIGQTICRRRTHTILRMGEDSPVALPAKTPR
jgi:hypothetical protein